LSPSNIVVRHCDSLGEFDVCVAIQRTVWGEDITVPAPLFVVAKETGGQVLGAFEGARMIGFTLALAGFHEGRPLLHSHMTALLPEFQNRGIGRLLKLAQRDDALRRGITLVEWTFDPLELRNAHFNLMRLGAIVRRYIPNCYGITESPLHAGLPTDRLMAEWRLDSRRVKGIVAGSTPRPGDSAAKISIPSDIGEWKAKDQSRARRVQDEVRGEFQHWFNEGYVAIALERAGQMTNYILEPPAARAGWE
jgi:predicted GNAT superfamily acetyltransferase